MPRTVTVSFGLAALLLAASCSSVPQPAPASVPVKAPAALATSPDGAEACRAAVASTAARPIADTSLLSTETSRAGLAARIALKGAARPWLCIAGPDGIVRNVSYMGEG
ncbi:hypothetical protein [Gellertiella hungarica]|uniref:Uncharacterized protein n=1 Tax=Gellertiella hungarica TaxID=1572859 RepID=A0A7W6J307_9HYPH|nr:hypothetical protein [Gellertiella hungarica]MBB4063182.1 hypothetical protein [Gellertiella hungarica]